MNDHPTELPEDDGISLLDILQTLAENARLLVYGPIVLALAAVGLAFLFKPVYEAETRFMPPQQQSGGAAAALMAQFGALAGMAGAGGGGAGTGSANLYVGLLKSRTIADRLVDQFSLMKLPNVETREDARDVLERVTRISVGRDGLITLQILSKVPRLSAAMANAYVKELSLLNDRLAVTEAQTRRHFLEKELAKIKDSLAKSEVALSNAGVSEKTLKFNPAAIGQGVAAIEAQIMARELTLASMRGSLTENSPDFRRVQQELSTLRAQLGKIENTQPTDENAEYIRLYRDFKYNEALFEQMSKQYELAKLDELREGAVIQVVDIAVPPERKANARKVIVGFVAWLASGVLLLIYVFVRRALSSAEQAAETAPRIAEVRAGFGRVLRPWRRRAGAKASG